MRHRVDPDRDGGWMLRRIISSFSALDLLMLAAPAALLGRFLHWPALLIFALSGVAIVPLAKWMGTATEELAHHLGPGPGGLLNATAGIAVMSEVLVHSLEEAVHTLGWSELFVGVILIPVVGNAAEHLTAVIVARKGQMDLSFSIAIGSSTQVALLIAPILVFVGLLVGHPLTFLFRPVELVALVSSVLIVCVISL